MSLFTLSEAPTKSDAASCVVTGQSFYFSGNTKDRLKDKVGRIEADQNVFYTSCGDWSTHDLIAYLLEQTGPASLYFTTWAISEIAIRQLYNLVKIGLLTSITGIFDYRNARYKSGELGLLSNIATVIVPKKCHAKVAILENQNWGISIVGSANFTRNPRWEAGVINTEVKVSKMYINWINQLIHESE